MADIVGPTHNPKYAFEISEYTASNEKQEGVLENIATINTNGAVHTVVGFVRVKADVIMSIDILPDETADPDPSVATVAFLLADESKIMRFPEKSKIRFRTAGTAGNFYIEPLGY